MNAILFHEPVSDATWWISAIVFIVIGAFLSYKVVYEYFHYN